MFIYYFINIYIYEHNKMTFLIYHFLYFINKIQFEDFDDCSLILIFALALKISIFFKFSQKSYFT